MAVKDSSGKLFILIRLMVHKPKDLIKTLASTSTDHSTLFQNFLSTELLNATVQTTSGSRDGEIMLLLSNGTSMEFPRLSRTTTGSHTPLISNPMEAQATSDAQPLTQDGGNCSDMKTTSLPMKEER
jgi:hypothetical protein